jgi:hypothetical protein
MSREQRAIPIPQQRHFLYSIAPHRRINIKDQAGQRGASLRLQRAFSQRSLIVLRSLSYIGRPLDQRSQATLL